MTCELPGCAEPTKWRVVILRHDGRRTERSACDAHEREIYETGLAAPWCRAGWRDPIAQPKSPAEIAA